MTDGRRDRIDSHHHFWRYDPERYGWISDRMAALRRDFGPADLKETLTGTGVAGVISVQAQQSMEETWALLEHAQAHDWIHGVVGWLPLVSPDLQRLLPTVAGHPKLRGVRHVVQDEPDDNFLLREDFNHGVAALKPFGLVYDILIYERHLPQTIQFVDRHPHQVFVLDHIAKPRIREGVLSPWRERIEELAQRPNVYCKVSGMVAEADWTSWTAADLRPYLDVVFDCFGPGRLLFGSDWPVCLVASTYAHWVETVAEALSEFSEEEQQRFWFGTATEVYRL